MTFQSIFPWPLRYRRLADVCYRGQGARLRVALDGARDVATIRRRFLEQYRARYGSAWEDQAIQIVNLRVAASREQPPPPVALDFPGGASLEAACKGERPAWDPGARALVAHRVYAMDRLPPGATLEGPAIVEETSSTVVLGRDARARVDSRGWLDISLDFDGASPP